MKIGMIAMSGIRVQDAELLKLGLTLPGFVERSRTIASLPSLGLLTLAGMTPKEHDVQYIEFDDIHPSGMSTDFDLVAISTFSAQAHEAYALADHFRRSGVQVVIGGLHATSVPDEAGRHGASVVVGEGEAVWESVLRHADHRQLQPLYDGRKTPVRLDSSPFPAIELLEIDKYNRLTVQASRGCPWECSFCASSILLTPRYKQKPIDRVLREIDRIRDLWPRPFLEFADDNAFVNRSYWHRLLPELSKRHLRWFAESDLSIHEDDLLLRELKQAGCVEVLIGFESPIALGLDGIELRTNWKKRKWPVYKEAIRKIQSHGIRVNACFVVGLDGHTPAIFDALLEFVEDARPFDVQITYPTPFPGTPFYNQLKSEGRLTHDGDWSRCTLFDISFEPRPMDADQLRAGFHDLTRRLYSEDFTRWRREEFRSMRQRRRTSVAG